MASVRFTVQALGVMPVTGHVNGTLASAASMGDTQAIEFLLAAGHAAGAAD